MAVLCIEQVQGFEEARRHFGRTRKYQSLRHCFLSVWREEGMLAFYKGSSASILKVCYIAHTQAGNVNHRLSYISSGSSEC